MLDLLIKMIRIFKYIMTGIDKMHKDLSNFDKNKKN